MNRFYVSIKISFLCCFVFTLWALETFVPHGLTLCVSEGLLSVLLCIHNVGKETSGLHGLILCVSEGVLSQLLCAHNVGIGTFHLHALILCVSEGLLLE